MEPIVKLETAPTLTFARPRCGACAVDVISGSDEYQCPVCGTKWPFDFDEDETGILYEEWSGETIDLPFTDRADVWRVIEQAARARWTSQWIRQST